MPHSWTAHVAVAAGFCALAGVVGAGDQPDTPKLGGLSLEELLNVPVVSASRIEEPLLTAPATIYVISEETIETLGLRSLAEVLALVPGVDALDPHFFMLGGQRGFAGTFAQTLLLVDGREMNNLIAGEAFISNQFRTANIARIEIINGPGSALYGANAVAGVINLITKAGTLPERIDVTVAAGSFSTAEAGVMIGGRAGALRLAGSLDLFRSRGDDFSRFLSDTSRASPMAENNDYRHLPDILGYDNESEAVYLRLRGEIGSFYGGTEYYLNESGRGTSGIQWDYNEGGDHRDLFLQYLGWKSEGVRGTPFDVRVEYRFYWEQFWGDHTEGEGPLVDPVTGEEITTDATPDDVERYRGFYSNRRSGGSTRHVLVTESSGVVGRSTLTGGITAEYSDVVAAVFARGEGPHPPIGPEQMRPEYSNWKGGIYLQDQVRLMGGRLVATVGARYDEHEIHGGSFNPRFGLVYRVGEGSVLKLLYGEAFREPNVFELQNSIEIKPMNLRTWEAGWQQSIGSGIHNRVVAFYNDVDDLIVADSADPGGISNRGRFRSRGVENLLDFRFGAWSGSAGYTYTTGELDEPETGDQPAYDVPEHKASLAVRYRFGERWPFAAVLRYRSDVETLYHDEAFRIDSYTVLDLGIGPVTWPVLSGLTLQLTARNVLDEEYFHAEPRAPTVVLHPQDGRSLELRLRWRQ